MTNTASPASAEFAQLAAFARKSAESQLAEAKLAMSETLAQDPGYAIEWLSEKVVRAAYRAGVWTVADEHGSDALAAQLSATISATAQSTSAFANARAAAERDEALSALKMAAPHLDAAFVLERLT